MNALPLTSSESSNSAPTSQRLPWLDSLKGLAILLVVLGHSCGGIVSANPGVEGFAFVLNRAIYSFHMPLFLLISVMVFSMAYVGDDWSPKTRKIGRQVLNLAIVYAVFSIIYVAPKLLMPEMGARKAAPLDLISFVWKPFGMMWYLYALTAMYGLSTMGLKWFGVRWAWALPVAVFAMMIMWSVAPVYEFALTNFVQFLPFFLLGVFWWRMREVEWPLVVSALVLSVVGYVLSAPLAGFYVAFGISLFAVFAFRHVRPLDCSFLRLLGRYTLEIYIIHTFVIALVRFAVNKVGGVPDSVHTFLAFAVSTAASLAVVWLLERVGVHDIIFRPVKWREARQAKQAN